MILGISVDKIEDQEKFTRKEDLNYPLLADPQKKAARAYGVLGPGGLARRVTFVIDKEGIVRKVYPNVKAAEHADEVLVYVKENLAGK